MFLIIHPLTIPFSYIHTLAQNTLSFLLTYTFKVHFLTNPQTSFFLIHSFSSFILGCSPPLDLPSHKIRIPDVFHKSMLFFLNPQETSMRSTSRREETSFENTVPKIRMRPPALRCTLPRSKELVLYIVIRISNPDTT